MVFNDERMTLHIACSKPNLASHGAPHVLCQSQHNRQKGSTHWMLDNQLAAAVLAAVLAAAFLAALAAAASCLQTGLCCCQWSAWQARDSTCSRQ
jgi:hypothetical protein